MPMPDYNVPYPGEIRRRKVLRTVWAVSILASGMAIGYCAGVML